MQYSEYPISRKYKGQVALGVDYGTKFTGLALYKLGEDPFPMPFDRIAYKDDEDLIKDIHHIIEQECVDIVVLGMPFFTDGKESEMTKKVKAFFDKLCQKNDTLKYFTQDETLSSEEAKNRMKSSPRYNFEVDMKQIDAVAACIILEDFIRNWKTDSV